MTHDRVMRFLPIFDSLEQAVRYAIDQALAWIGPSTNDRAPCTATPD